MRILVTGDRNWTDREKIKTALHEVCAGKTIVTDVFVLIHGGARGADTLAGDVADELAFDVIEVYPAQWDKYHRAAGPIRNKQMLDEGKPDMVLAFHSDIENSKGTKHMIGLAKKANIPVRLIV